MTHPSIAEARVRVRYAETDAQGVVYYSNYLVWFEVGRVEYMRQMGLSYAALEKRSQGMMVVEATCRYRAPAHFDDELIVRTWCDELKQSSFRCCYAVQAAAEAASQARGRTTDGGGGAGGGAGGGGCSRGSVCWQRRGRRGGGRRGRGGCDVALEAT